MKTVGDLRGIRSPLTDTRAIGFSPVPGHHLDLRMGLKPSRDRLGPAVLEPIDWATLLQIDDNRAIAMAFAPGPIVDANDVRWRPLGYSQSSHATQAYGPDGASVTRS